MKMELTIVILLMMLSIAGRTQGTDPSPYCNAVPAQGVYGLILNVSLGTLNAANALSGSYYYYSNVTAPVLVRGQTYTLTVVFDSLPQGQADNSRGYAWIDFNPATNITTQINFDPVLVDASQFGLSAEQVLVTRTAQVTIPANAALGITRLRVERTNQCISSANTGQACDCQSGHTATLGQTLDYNVQIADSTVGNNCNYSVSPAIYTCASSVQNAYIAAITVGAGNTCSWTAQCVSTDNWLASFSSGTGNGTIDIDVLANTDSSSRTGYIQVGNQVVTVIQPGVGGCTDNLSVSTYACPSAATNHYGAVCEVTTQSNCSWTATSANNWLVTFSSGTGSGAIDIDVLQNTDSATRTGIIQVGGQILTVIQPGIGTTGIAGINTAYVGVSPNPGKGLFKFTGLPQGDLVSVFNVLGQCIFTGETSNSSYLLNLTNSAKGIYFYKVLEGTTAVAQGKLILE